MNDKKKVSRLASELLEAAGLDTRDVIAFSMTAGDMPVVTKTVSDLDKEKTKARITSVTVLNVELGEN